MRFFILIVFAFSMSGNVFGQDQCTKAMSFFKLWDNTVKSGKSSYDRIRLTELDDKQRKAYNKIVSTAKKAFGDYGEKLTVSRMHELRRGDNEDQHYVYVCTVEIYNYTYGFEVAANKKGKITSKIPFKKSKKEIIDPCTAMKKAEVQLNFNKAVGIKMAMNNGKLTWEIWEEGKTLSVQPDGRGLMHSEHHVILIDAYNNGMIKRDIRKLERIQ